MPTFGGLLSPQESAIGVSFLVWALLGLMHPGALRFALPENRVRTHAFLFPLALCFFYFLSLLSFAGEKWPLFCCAVLGLIALVGYYDFLRGRLHFA